MSVKGAGEKWFDKNHHDDNKIKQIDSPGDVGVEVIKIIDKNIADRWMLAKIRYGADECLGLRWFTGKSGFPSSRGYATWLVINKEMLRVISNVFSH